MRAAEQACWERTTLTTNGSNSFAPTHARAVTQDEKVRWEIGCMDGWMDTDFSLVCLFVDVCKEEFHIPKTASVFFQVVTATRACAAGI